VSLDSSIACWRTRKGQTASRVISVRPSVFSLSVSSCLDQILHLLKPSLAAVNAIEIIDYGVDLAETNYARVIQLFHRFLLDHLAVEEESYTDNPSLLLPDPSFPQRTATSPPITQLLGMYSRNISICTYCKGMREKEQVTFVIDLIYSRKVDLGSHSIFPRSFILPGS
jgi:hypothetical protein